MKRTFLALASAALFAGCAATVQRPTVVLPAAFASATPENAEAPAPDARWWYTFADPTLDELVAAAAAANHDVRIAAARVQAARAGADASGARLLPALNAAGSASDQRSGYGEAIRQRLPDTSVERAALDLTWEIDLFGAARASRNASRADALAAEHARRGAVLAAVAETARQYFVLRGAQEQRAIVRALAATQRETLRLTQLRRAAGQASDFDVDRAAADLASTEALVPRLEAQVAVTRFRLATLTGRPPTGWDALLIAERPALPVPPPPVQQPAALLQRRPDVMAAEAQFVAAGERRREAQAARFPRVFVSALFGRQWTALNGFDLGAARFSQAGAALALPLFAGGRIEAGIEASGAREREAVAAYEKAVLQALEDVEAALTALAADGARAADLDRAVSAREAALARARALYRAGQADLLQVLDVERGLLAAQLERSANHTARLAGTVLLYRALGGGWQAFEAAADPSLTTTAARSLQ